VKGPADTCWDPPPPHCPVCYKWSESQQDCIFNCKWEKCQTCTEDGCRDVYADDPNMFCCNGAGCSIPACHQCVDGQCKVCGDDPYKTCCDGTCCDWYHQCEDCKWYAQLEAVNTTVGICRSCPSNPPSVCCLGDVGGMTKQQACAQYNKYPHDPLLISDMFGYYFENNCWCQHCVAVHEEEHMNQDWVQECLNPAIGDFKAHLAANPIDIDCSVGSSVDCQTAITAAIQTQYNNKWRDLITDALNKWDNDPDQEGDARAAERDCYQQIIDTLRNKCNTP